MSMSKSLYLMRTHQRVIAMENNVMLNERKQTILTYECYEKMGKRDWGCLKNLVPTRLVLKMITNLGSNFVIFYLILIMN